MGFSRQEYWSGLPFPSPEYLTDPGIKPGFPAVRADTLTTKSVLWPLKWASQTLFYPPYSNIYSIKMMFCVVMVSVFHLDLLHLFFFFFFKYLSEVGPDSKTSKQKSDETVIMQRKIKRSQMKKSECNCFSHGKVKQREI